MRDDFKVGGENKMVFLNEVQRPSNRRPPLKSTIWRNILECFPQKTEFLLQLKMNKMKVNNKMHILYDTG